VEVVGKGCPLPPEMGSGHGAVPLPVPDLKKLVQNGPFFVQTFSVFRRKGGIARCP